MSKVSETTRKANSDPPFFGRICAIVVQFLTQPHGGMQRSNPRSSSRRHAGIDVARVVDVSQNFG
jgi:hypothetical protein